MKPVLLDQYSLFKAGAGFFLALGVVFLCGYYIGHQKAASGGGMEFNRTVALALPRPAYADPAAFEQQPPPAPAPGADIDVDSADASADAAASGSDASNTLLGDGVEAITAISDASAAAGADPAGQQLQLASLAPVTAVNSADDAVASEPMMQPAHGPAAEQQAAGIDAQGEGLLIEDTANADDARYTIQVGVFADEQNALRKKSELDSLRLNAYIDEYTNKRKEPRYNVRFGYFRHRTGALAALDTFEKDMAGSGYVTRIRRD